MNKDYLKNTSLKGSDDTETLGELVTELTENAAEEVSEHFWSPIANWIYENRAGLITTTAITAAAYMCYSFIHPVINLAGVSQYNFVAPGQDVEWIAQNAITETLYSSCVYALKNWYYTVPAALSGGVAQSVGRAISNIRVPRIR